MIFIVLNLNILIHFNLLYALLLVIDYEEPPLS